MKYVLTLLAVMLLAGCQSNPQRAAETSSMDSKAGVDTTGALGSPVERRSAANVYVELGTAYLQDGVLGEALKNARKAIIVDPELAPAHNLLGIVYQRLGKTVLAGEHLAKAVSSDPYDPYALNALGSFEYDAAISRFKAALHNPLYPTPWVASHNAGQCSERQGNAAKAEDYYRAALKRKPGFAQSLARMGHISADKGQSLSVRAYLQRYAGISPLALIYCYLVFVLRMHRGMQNKLRYMQLNCASVIQQQRRLSHFRLLISDG